MKTALTAILSIMFFMAAAQTPDVSPTPKKTTDNYPRNSRQHTSPVKTSSRPANNTRNGDANSPAVRPTPNNRPTEINRSNAANTTTPNATTQGAKNQAAPAASPFVSGITAAPNAARTFDTVVTTGPAASGTVGTVIPGGNDTTFNSNTIAPTSGVGSTSGAVDRSGQSQFGQTNWGRNEHRNTVGESQWTIPPPITASFNREFPEQNQATWIRNQVDTNQYSVRYRQGANWVTSTYDASGTRINMRTDIPLVQAPAPVSGFIAKQPSTFQVASISRINLQGRPEVYELRLANGQSTYVNNDGMEVRF
jgi:hypothetical protein